MSDKLENFVGKNREHFDDRTPHPGNWTKISEALFGKKGEFFLNSVGFWRIAAFLLLGVSVFLFFNKQNGVPLTRQTSQQEFTDVESYYAAQIQEKVMLISTEAPFADDSYTQDLQKLEAMYTVLAEDIKKRPSERVKDALVLNMLVRIDLLNQQIQKLEESKRSKGGPATI